MFCWLTLEILQNLILFKAGIWNTKEMYIFIMTYSNVTIIECSVAQLIDLLLSPLVSFSQPISSTA